MPTRAPVARNRGLAARQLRGWARDRGRGALACEDEPVHVESIGQGPRHLLILPGWCLDSQTEIPEWDPVMRERPDWTTHYVDLPGTGLSRGKEDRVADMDEILSRVVGLVDEQLGNAGPLAVGG